MAYTTPPTVSTGQTWTAANQNQYIRDNFIDLVAYKGTKVIRTSNQAITGALAYVSFDTEDHDTDAFHAGGDPTKITIPAGFGGYYYINAHVLWAGGAGDNEMKIIKNAATVLHLTSCGSEAAGTSSWLAFSVLLAATDYLRVGCVTAINKNIEHDNNSLFFGAYLLRS